jgi:hypothetical protein
MSTEATSPPVFPDAPVYDPHDLEFIVTSLELGALDLTDKPNRTFIFDELLSAANDINRGAPLVDEKDAQIVLPFLKFLKRVPNSGRREKLYVLK